MNNRFGDLFGRVPYGDPDKCWGCGLFRQWDGVTLLCPTCRELQLIYLFAERDTISRGDRIHYENIEARAKRQDEWKP